MDTALQVICRIGILAPVWFCASQVIGVTLYSPVEVPKANETPALEVPSNVFVPQPNDPPLFTRGSGTR